MPPQSGQTPIFYKSSLDHKSKTIKVRFDFLAHLTRRNLKIKTTLINTSVQKVYKIVLSALLDLIWLPFTLSSEELFSRITLSASSIFLDCGR